MADATTTLPVVPPVTPNQTGGNRNNTENKEPRRRSPQFAFLVELSGPKNENVLCPIDNHVCRGRWSRKNLARSGAQIEGDFNGMPDLPGLCFVINTDKRTIRRFDPLADDDNAKLLKRAQRIALAVTGIKMTAEKSKTWKERACDDNTLKTFVFWILRLKDAGLVNVIKGRVPEFEEIRKMTGVIQLKQFDQLAGIVRGCPDDAIRYVKPVPADEEEDRDEQFMDEIPDPVINSDGMGFSRDDEDEEG